jgi:hypothetical protein
MSRFPYPYLAGEVDLTEVVARRNPATGEVENFEVLFFSTQLLRGELFNLLITAERWLARNSA